MTSEVIAFPRRPRHTGAMRTYLVLDSAGFFLLGTAEHPLAVPGGRLLRGRREALA